MCTICTVQHYIIMQKCNGTHMHTVKVFAFTCEEIADTDTTAHIAPSYYIHICSLCTTHCALHASLGMYCPLYLLYSILVSVSDPHTGSGTETKRVMEVDHTYLLYLKP